MSALLHRNPNSQPPIIVRAAGCYLYDRAGRDYLDASSSAGAAIMGGEDTGPWEFCAPPHSAVVTTDSAEHLAQLYVDQFGDPEAGVFFLSTGAEAIEAACKIAIFCQQQIVGRRDWRILSRRRSYHGNTIMALGLSDTAARREPFNFLLSPKPYLWPIPAYPTDRQGSGDWEGFHRANVMRLDDDIDAGRHRSGTTAAVLVETVAGTMAGVVPPPLDYLRELRALCDRNQWLLIADEILCGNHRVGQGLFPMIKVCRPDIAVIGKSLAAGWWPLSAVVVSGHVRKVLQDAKQLPHTATFMNHGVACEAGVSVSQSWLRYANTNAPQLLRGALGDLFSEYKCISQLRGMGMLYGLDLQDPETGRACPASAGMAYRAQQACLESGLIIYAARGCRGDYEGDQLVVMPAYTIKDAEIEVLVQRLRTGLQKAFESRHN